MDRLFLLKPGFLDANVDQQGRKYYCPSCAAIEGALFYYPHLREKLEVIYIDFPRPRQAIVDLIGEAYQRCPMLIIGEERDGAKFSSSLKESNGMKFLNSTDQIMHYLAVTYGVGFPHP